MSIESTTTTFGLELVIVTKKRLGEHLKMTIYIIMYYGFLLDTDCFLILTLIKV